ncbi:hypothetical protein [Epilithonimonas arachidiradicis]|uniref:Lipoprotein n=1 Tax=Epilithonimonas arachidiradicis TaxID=1617282 RepID=A0A420CYC8_9FLAO|nr:hypothetical protein [Epilithonimonas arachidiradicis]RKE83255.1 hypothetical protein BXY58_2810 [Epilithonimonas arachidiradicis]GGG65999.1 hypothetical protein GCM10007332_30800 [Epilithonimonas arachidiradicis]
MKKLITLLSAFLIIVSCNKKEEIPKEKTTTSKKEELENEYEEPDEDPAYVFPKTGKKAEDFITEPDIFEIQYQAEGDLNDDKLEDIVIVRKDKKYKTAPRSILVLLQNPDKTYRLDKVSHLAMPAEYNDSDFKLYDTEDISIDKGILSIQLYGIGPSGNLFSDFKYFGNDLLLTDIETYNMGAGSHQSLDYDVLKGELLQELTNTMEEEMPTTEKTFHLKPQKIKFENASPDAVIAEAYVIDAET